MVISQGSKLKKDEISKRMKGLQSALTKNPLSTFSLPLIHAGWLGLQSSETVETYSSIALREHRFEIMMTNYFAWYWLDVFIPDQCYTILINGYAGRKYWLVQLVNDVKTMYDLRGPTTEFSASKYGIDLNEASYTFNTMRNTFRVAYGTKEARDRIVRIVMDILQSWLSFPIHRSGQLQAWFVHVLIKEIGPNVLYLNSIWSTYLNAQNRLFTSESWKLTSFRSVLSLAKTASHHPLFEPTSSERSSVDKIAKLIQDFRDGKLILDANADETTPLFVDRLPSDLRSVANHQQNQFINFIRDCMAIHLNLPFNIINPKLPEQLQTMTDKLLPFRECAPSRSRIRGDDGPFGNAVIQTTEGVFSALIWRGITYSTPFSMRGRMTFKSVEDFRQARDEFPNESDDFFCDPCAYGQHNKGRNLSLAPLYMKGLKNNAWPNFVQDKTLPVPFMEALKFFQNSAKFPSLGPLGAYLLTADYSYTNVVATPTSEEVAMILRDINKGAVSAFEVLKLIPPRKTKASKATLTDCQAAFTKVIQIVKDVIPAEYHTILHLDAVMVEHLLCKYSRSLRKGILK